jgi:hypothetical protein
MRNDRAWMYGATFAIRYAPADDYFYVYLMWIAYAPPHQWLAQRSHNRHRYRSLERALKSLQTVDAVMIFPV